MQRKLGCDLHPDDRRRVLDGYPMRMTHESGRRWPGASARMLAGGYRLSIVSDAEWLAHTTFAVRKDGRLALRGNANAHCEHDSSACRSILPPTA